MLIVTKNFDEEQSRSFYTFTNRGVDYTIFKNVHFKDAFDVWTTRKSLGNVNVRVMTRKEMDHGPKVFQEFLAHLELEELDAVVV